MVDIYSKSKRSEIMARIRSKDTSPELFLRKFLFSNGFRYRVCRKDLPGKPDLLLPKYRTAIFVNGCFWHGHSCKIGSKKRMPKSNSEYWNEKIRGNIFRDKQHHKELKKMGWRVIVVWECEIQNGKRIMKELIPLIKREKKGLRVKPSKFDQHVVDL